MNKDSLIRHQDKAQEMIERLRPGTVTIGVTPYNAGVSVAPREVETDKGGTQVLDSIIASISKTALATAPTMQSSLEFEGESYTIYMTAGKKAQRWKIHAAKFPK